MNAIRYINKVRARLLLLMSAVILLTACSDDTDMSSNETDILRIAAYTQDMESSSMPAATRAVSVPSGYSLYNGSASIGVFMTLASSENSTGSSPEMTLISYEDNAWHSMVKVSPTVHYYIYGYMPAYVKSTITKIPDPDNSDAANPTYLPYDDGAILTFSEVPSVLSEDFSVITGVQDLPNQSADVNLRAGKFAFIGKASGDNFVNLMFDHLYGALNVSFRVDAKYNALRTIKLKELKLRTLDAEGPSKSKTTVTVILNKTEGTTPIADVTFTPSSSSEDVGDISFFQSATGEELGITYKSFMGHFMPQGITSLVVTSVYDVYDKNITDDHPDGNLIRKDCTAENILKISELFDGQTVTKRGNKYNVYMTIMPTYLYVLSEPDLDNPTVVVN